MEKGTEPEIAALSPQDMSVCANTRSWQDVMGVKVMMLGARVVMQTHNGSRSSVLKQSAGVLEGDG